jgi:hypothetical protein
MLKKKYMLVIFLLLVPLAKFYTLFNFSFEETQISIRLVGAKID